MSEWISVEDKLPEFDIQVFIMIDECGASVGSYDSKYGGCWRIGNDNIAWDHDFSFGCEVKVTHWMPITEVN